LAKDPDRGSETLRHGRFEKRSLRQKPANDFSSFGAQEMPACLKSNPIILNILKVLGGASFPSVDLCGTVLWTHKTVG
jgi:hypothetical protein